jgi:hypothetical protein
MACRLCLAARQRAVRIFCKRPDSLACRKAREALQRLIDKENSAKMAGPNGAGNTGSAPDHNAE